MKHLDDPTAAEVNGMVAGLALDRQYHVTNVDRTRLTNALARKGVKASVRQHEGGFLVTYISGGDAQIGVRPVLDRLVVRGAISLADNGLTREAVERVMHTLPGKRFEFQPQEDGDTLVYRVD